jgi:8-oxo-dGTP diphosphatase
MNESLLIVAAIIRRGNEILLVEQQGPNDPASAWALPGGRVEPDELLVEALAREVREETGVTVREPGHLAYIVQHTRLDSSGLVTVLAFEIADWEGEVRTMDPDNLILQARFAPIPDAIHKLEQTLRFRMMREPIVAYLRGEVGAGAMWFYRRQPDGIDILIACLRR